MKPITQREVLKGVRKPMPRPTEAITPKKAKVRRKRVKLGNPLSDPYAWKWIDL